MWNPAFVVAPEPLPIPVVPAGAKVHIHPTSIIHHKHRVTTSGVEMFAFSQKVKTSQVFLRDVTIVSPAAVLLFGGDIQVQHRENMISVDKWIKLRAPAKTAVIFKELREELNLLLLRKLRDPGWDFHADPFTAVLIDLLTSSV